MIRALIELPAALIGIAAAGWKLGKTLAKILGH